MEAAYYDAAYDVASKHNCAVQEYEVTDSDGTVKAYGLRLLRNTSISKAGSRSGKGRVERAFGKLKKDLPDVQEPAEKGKAFAREKFYEAVVEWSGSREAKHRRKDAEDQTDEAPPRGRRTVRVRDLGSQ